MPWESAIESVTGLVSELITDPDKKAEIELELQRIDAGIRSELLKTKTTPWTDAFVKLLIAFRDIIIPLLRPFGSACMTAFGMYCHIKGIEIDTGLLAMFDGAFPAWGASRHINKKDQIKAKTKANNDEWDQEY